MISPPIRTVLPGIPKPLALNVPRWSLLHISVRYFGRDSGWVRIGELVMFWLLVAVVTWPAVCIAERIWHACARTAQHLL